MAEGRSGIALGSPARFGLGLNSLPHQTARFEIGCLKNPKSEPNLLTVLRTDKKLGRTG